MPINPQIKDTINNVHQKFMTYYDLAEKYFKLLPKKLEDINVNSNQAFKANLKLAAELSQAEEEANHSVYKAFYNNLPITDAMLKNPSVVSKVYDNANDIARKTMDVFMQAAHNIDNDCTPTANFIQTGQFSLARKCTNLIKDIALNAFENITFPLYSTDELINGPIEESIPQTAGNDSDTHLKEGL